MNQTRFKSQMNKFVWGFCFLFVCCCLSAALATDDKEDIPMQGEWEEGKRSLQVECPVSVSWDGTCLYVVNLSPRSTIHVTLSNGAENICDETIPAGTCPATIYVGTLESGQSYQLVLTNQFGDRLEGTID